jgi:hypothetical protein
MTKTTSTTTAPDIESLVRDYYIHSSGFIHDHDDYDNTKKQQQEWSNGENDNNSNSFSYRYCDICRLDRADWLKYYCYSNKGLNRQLITICIKCLDKYNHIDHKQRLQRLLEQQRFVAENNACLNNGNRQHTVTIGGVIDIKTADNAKDQIMLLLACILAINSKSRKKISIIATIASNPDSDDVNDDEDYLFYSAVRMAYDQSEDVRKYFCNNPSRISSKNKGLWPLRYQAYRQFGI